MEKINLVEILKDCPKGMELDCTMFDNVKFIDVKENDSSICIKTGDNISYYYYLTKFGTWTFDENAKCVIFPKGKTTWEGFIPLYKFKEGDVIFKRNFIAIIHLIEEEGKIWYHCWFNTKYENYKLKKDYGIGNINDGDEVRLATEEEKAKLFKAIKENGYRWDEETKSLEKLVEPYTEQIKETMEPITIDDFKANTKEWLIDKLESMSKDNALQAICNIHDELHKPQYPKTYEECCDVLGLSTMDNDAKGYKGDLIIRFQELLIARDAYWKIAGEQMGLEKPWESNPSNEEQHRYAIYNYEGTIVKNDFWLTGVNAILVFPTEEMRDAFLENFKELIKECISLL